MAAQRSFKPLPPLVGIPACFRDIAGTGFHMVADKYVLAAVEAAGATAMILPALGERQPPESVLVRLDGLLVTGSPSNVEPTRYGGPASDAGTLHDPTRDASNLPLIPAAISAGIPLLAICRGFQELNVAFGGTLHQKIHALPGRIDHRADSSRPIDVQYGPSHAVSFVEGGFLRRIAGTDRAIVNSLHSQGVDRIADGLAVEAVADDGQIEALRVEGASTFALGVQWHPEHRHAENPVSRAIFGAFADAIRRRQSECGRAAA